LRHLLIVRAKNTRYTEVISLSESSENRNE